MDRALGAFRGMGGSRPLAWVLCGGAAAALAMAMANPRVPVQPVRTVEVSRPSQVAALPARPQAPSVSTSAAAAPVSKKPETTVEHPAAASSDVSAAPDSARDVVPASQPAAVKPPAPARKSPDVKVEDAPQSTETRPAVSEPKKPEPQPPVVMPEAPATLPVAGAMPKDAMPVEVMGMMTPAMQKMAGGDGTGTPIPDDDGLAELRQFLEMKRTNPRRPDDKQDRVEPGADLLHPM